MRTARAELRSDRVRRGKSSLPVVLAALALVGVGGWLIYQLAFNGERRVPQKGSDAAEVSPALFQKAVEAVAASEEADFRRAIRLWDELSQAAPARSTLRLNQAITVLKWISDINTEIASGRATPEQIKQLNAELDEAFTQVEGIFEKLSTSEINNDRGAWVQAALLETKSLRERGNSELLKQAADVLAVQLQHSPGEALMSAKFEELASQIEVEHPELRSQRTDILFQAFERNPRNLFLLKSTADALLSQQDPRLKQLLQPSVDVPGSMLREPSVSRLVERLKPDQLILDVGTAIDAGDWNAARRLTGWVNTLMATSGFLPDSKRIKPDVMALLDANFLVELARNVPKPTAPTVTDLHSFAAIALPGEAQAAVWFDFDFDLDFDVVLVRGQQLIFHELIDGSISLEPTARLDLDFAVTGMLPIDMFVVQSPDRPQPFGTVAELVQSPNGNAPIDNAPKSEGSITAERHDTRQELLVWGAEGMRVVIQSDPRTFSVLEASTGLENLRDVRRVEPLDFESDGDLDLAIISGSGIRLMQNNGNRTFQEVTEFSSLPDACLDLVSCDFDGDTDQDLLAIVPNEDNVLLLENIQYSQFRAVALEGDVWKTVADARAIHVADLDNSSSWDVITSSPTSSKITYTRRLDGNTVAGSLTVDLPIGSNLTVGDLNNDGFQDFIAAGNSGPGSDSGMVGVSGLNVEQSLTANREPTSLGLGGQTISHLSVMDCNQDGMLDALVIADGKAAICMPSTTSPGNYALVRVAGINDVNGGGRVNHFGLGSIVEIWAEAEHFSRIVRGPQTHFGLGERTPDNLRIIFPNGLTQNVEKPDVDSLIEEKQVQRGSCPYAYGWDGERFVMITDLLWNAPLGLQIARGKVLPDRRWENLLLPAAAMQPRDGAYELRITEELWEFAYFDHVRLTAIDHPGDLRVFTNEKVGPAELAEHKVFATRERLLPNRATDGYGRDVLDQISAQDSVYVQAFERQVCQGLCEPHFIELDFGSLPTDEYELRLFLTGWLYPTDTSLNIGIDQNPDRSLPEPPSLWVVDQNGKWVCAQPFMGFPGGKPKTIAIDLDGVFLSDDHRLRIGSSQQLYWDEAFVSWHVGDEAILQQSLELQSADLRYYGFAAIQPRQPDQPHWFDYQQVRRQPNWPTLEGPFTRYGDVRDILREDDDRMAVLVSGDEMALRFAAPAIPLPEGWQRDFVLHCTGWDKDADLNTLQGQGSLPLPFMNQSAYPPGPDQAAEADAVLQKNADTLTRYRIDPPRSLRESPAEASE